MRSLTKNHLSICLTVCALAVLTLTPAWAAEGAKPELTFYASFDKTNANADVARGDGESDMKENLELRLTEGVKGGALLLEPGEQCTYAVKDNLNLKNATVSFWVAPFNWSSENNYHVMFFSIQSREPKFRMGIRCHGGKNGGKTILLLMENGKKGQPDYRMLQISAPVDWVKDKWTKIAAAWDESVIKLYVDGELVGSKETGGLDIPRLEDRRFRLTQHWSAGMSQWHNTQTQTKIDEFKIYDGMLTSGEIRRNYLADRGVDTSEMPQPMVRVPRAASAVTVDGRLDEAAWSKAARVPIRMGPDGYLDPRAAWALVTWDERALYVGFGSGHGKPYPLAAEVTEHDGRVNNDDSFELFVWPEAEIAKEQERFQWIVNAKGTVLDVHGNINWNGEIERRASVGDNEWFVEMAVPYATLGVTSPKAGDRWRANFCRNYWRPAEFRTPEYAAWMFGKTGYIGGQGRLVFDAGDRASRVALGDGFAFGDVDVTCGNPSASAGLELNVEARPPKGKAIAMSQSAAPGGEAVVKRTLKDFTEGLLVTKATSADGAPLYSHTARIYVREPIAVEQVPDIDNGRIGLRVDLSGLDAGRLRAVTAGKARLAVKMKQDDASPVEQTFPVREVRDIYWLPCEWNEKRQTFNFSLTVDAAGEGPLTVAREIVKPETPWLGTRVGVSDQVLSPWTPIEYKAPGVLGCWGREYDLRGVFPQAVENQGRPMLTGPIAMTIETDKGESTLSGAKLMSAPKEDPSHYDYRVVGSTAGGKFEADNFFEYDGLAVTHLRLTPPEGGWTVERVTLDIPLRADLVKYIRKPKRQEWNGRSWESDFEPYVWVGTEDEGFCWFVDSDANWIYDKSAKPTRITIDGDRALARLTLIAKPTQTDKPIEYLIGFMASPVKPMPEGWRNFNNHSMKMLKHQNWHTWGTSHRVHFAFVTLKDPEGKAKLLKERRRLGSREMEYVGAQLTAPSPMYDFFRALWENPYKSTDANTRSVCQASSYIDYLIWSLKQFNDKYDENSLYTDVDRLIPCNNRLHGCGYEDAFGRTGPTYHILDRRAFYRRLLTICRNAPGGVGVGRLMCHAHDNLVLPYHSSADYFYPGEQFSHNLYNNPWFYIDELDPVAWRVELCGKAFGIMHNFLPQFSRGGSKEYETIPGPTQSLIAVTVLNDIQSSANYCHDESFEEFWELKARTGLNRDDTKFIAWWRPDCPVAAKGEESFASVYVTGPKRATVAVVNKNAEARTVTVSVDAAALGLTGAATAVDERTGKPVAFEGGTFSVSVEGRNYTLVTLK